MVVKCQNEETVTDKYTFRRKAGRSIIEHRPLFSPDGESLLVIVENTVRVYNIHTGECVRTLETESHTEELVGIQFPHNGNYDLYGCSERGVITMWTWENGAVLREIPLHIPEDLKVVNFHLVDENECFLVSVNPNINMLSIALISIKTGNAINVYKHLEIAYRGIVSVALGQYNGDKYAAIVNGTMNLFIQSIYQPHIFTKIYNQNKLRIISVSAHNHENAVAITDTLGRVTIIRGNLYDCRNVVREVLHWHHLPSLASCFSLQGSYLYTGGIEKVLVKWTIGNLTNRANEKMFIPRLPGLIRYIATNNTYVAATLSNNSIVIANAQLRVVSTILECGGLSPVARAIGTSLVYHRPSGGLLMGGRTGHLQLYSTTTDKVLYNIDVTQQNDIPPRRHELLPLETEVTCAAVSGNGAWLVTSEYRNDGLTYPEEKLKFWQQQKNHSTPFTLNTCVNLSHGGSDVVSLCLSYKAEFCVSAGNDQKFRIWKKEVEKQKLSWSCLTACYYSSGLLQFLSHGSLNLFKNGPIHVPGEVQVLPYMRATNDCDDPVRKLLNVHKEHQLFNADVMQVGMQKNELAMGGVDISQDGSLIAAWFGSKLTLWDTHLCNLRTTLSHPELRPKGQEVKFGNREAAHYLVCTTEQCVAVWNLLSLTIKWMVQLSTTCLTADPLSNKMAVVTDNNDVFVFNPMSSKPILMQNGLLDPDTGIFKQCCFGASGKDEVRLFLSRNNSEIYCLEPERSQAGALQAITTRNVTSNFGALLAEQMVTEVTSTTNANIKPETAVDSALDQFLSAAPHMVPPLSLLSTAFLQSISGEEKHKPVNTYKDDEIMDLDPSSSEDEDEPTRTKPTEPSKPSELWTPNYDQIKEKRLNKILREPILDLHVTSSLFDV